MAFGVFTWADIANCDMSSNIKKVMAITGIMVPIVIIFCIFMWIRFQVKSMTQAIVDNMKRLRKRQSYRGSDHHSSILQIEQGVTFTTWMVIISSLVLSLPSAIKVVFFPKEAPELHIAFFIAFWLHFFTNPLIYVFTNIFYRRSFKRAFGLLHSNDWTLTRSATELKKMTIIR